MRWAWSNSKVMCVDNDLFVYALCIYSILVIFETILKRSLCQFLLF